MGFITKTNKDIKDTWQQWLSFSLNTWNTINYDLNAFKNMPDEGELGEFINRIIYNYYDIARCSFYEHRKEYLKIVEEFDCNLDEESKERFIQCMIKANANNDVSDKSVHLKRRFYLEYNIKQMLIDSKNDKYYNGIKEYLEAILNEYVSLPYYKREIIYFLDTYNSLKRAINNNLYIIIKVKDCLYTVRPFLIETDKSTGYNYLICAEGDEGIDNLKSFRLQHINIIHKTSDKFHKLSKDLMKELKSRVDQFSAPYLKWVSENNIKVQLTEQGMRNYKEWINQRPPYTEKCISTTDDKIRYMLSFNCSERQIQNYFFKFGAEAEILEPESLRNLFSAMYHSASELYINNTDSGD